MHCWVDFDMSECHVACPDSTQILHWPNTRQTRHRFYMLSLKQVPSCTVNPDLSAQACLAPVKWFMLVPQPWMAISPHRLCPYCDSRCAMNRLQESITPRNHHCELAVLHSSCPGAAPPALCGTPPDQAPAHAQHNAISVLRGRCPDHLLTMVG
jgi:hypothetical protein